MSEEPNAYISAGTRGERSLPAIHQVYGVVPVLTLFRWCPSGPSAEIKLHVLDRVISQVSRSDIFETFLAARLELEQSGFLICCAGSQRTVWPSGMQRQMSGGMKAYRWPEVRSSRPEVVEIFEEVHCDDAVTVAVQRQFAEDRAAPRVIV